MGHREFCKNFDHGTLLEISFHSKRPVSQISETWQQATGKDAVQKGCDEKLVVEVHVHVNCSSPKSGFKIYTNRPKKLLSLTTLM